MREVCTAAWQSWLARVLVASTLKCQGIVPSSARVEQKQTCNVQRRQSWKRPRQKSSNKPRDDVDPRPCLYVQYLAMEAVCWCVCQAFPTTVAEKSIMSLPNLPPSLLKFIGSRTAHQTVRWDEMTCADKTGRDWPFEVDMVPTSDCAGARVRQCVKGSLFERSLGTSAHRHALSASQSSGGPKKGPLSNAKTRGQTLSDRQPAVPLPTPCLPCHCMLSSSTLSLLAVDHGPLPGPLA